MLQGFPSQRAGKAVFRTHNCGVEPAVNWLMEHSSDADIDVPLELAVVSIIPHPRPFSLITSLPCCSVCLIVERCKDDANHICVFERK